MVLWHGSRKRFGARNFHRRWDGHAPTLALLRDTEGKLLGWFMLVEWESSCWCVIRDGLSGNAFFTGSPSFTVKEIGLFETQTKLPCQIMLACRGNRDSREIRAKSRTNFFTRHNFLKYDHGFSERHLSTKSERSLPINWGERPSMSLRQTAVWVHGAEGRHTRENIHGAQPWITSELFGT
jgi:hypothetical protein